MSILDRWPKEKFAPSPFIMCTKNKNVNNKISTELQRNPVRQELGSKKSHSLFCFIRWNAGWTFFHYWDLHRTIVNYRIEIRVFLFQVKGIIILETRLAEKFITKGKYPTLWSYFLRLWQLFLIALSRLDCYWYKIKYLFDENIH